ncbi:hypothetical protein PPL_08142 [Heterostelium album PN500]|uniref:Uncharacterized protein n=1 Tax=Heterostelium pallidum (strain ATCC 26659 / Pp 5 / PN500) TaxID=670386 RepID=D3BIQ7_HETP5|nr:hypothetical protein PPL_08142 [Heterostelium album PN500]EFA78681.1 hypothetical protein PPL_08142 [Heterostelium album PN500]|eukprot:XP_020430805.1 hypothetical protein PPL_08142 [Heterostelium album PN500]
MDFIFICLFADELVFACHLEDVELPVESFPGKYVYDPFYDGFVGVEYFAFEEVVLGDLDRWETCEYECEFSYRHVPEANASFFPAERSSFDSHSVFVFAVVTEVDAKVSFWFGGDWVTIPHHRHNSLHQRACSSDGRALA